MIKNYKKIWKARRKIRNPRILIVVPVYEKLKLLIPDLLWNIGNQKYRNYRALVIVNNSPIIFMNYVLREAHKVQEEHNKKYLFEVLDMGPIEKIGEYKGSISSQLYNIGIDYALKKNYDYILIHQGDVVIGDNTLRDLLRPFRKFKDCGISCPTCFERYSGDMGLQGVFDFMSDLPGEVDLGPQPKIPMIIPAGKRITSKEYYSKKYRKARAGDGVMMIPWEVFSRIQWRTRLKGKEKWGNDYAYCLDTLEELGLWTYINTRFYTPHLEVKSDGEIKYF